MASILNALYINNSLPTSITYNGNTVNQVYYNNVLVWPYQIEYGSKLITSTQTWTVPTNVYKIKVTCVGGGAGGVAYRLQSTSGGVGYYQISVPLAVGGSTIFALNNTNLVVAKGGTSPIFKYTGSESGCSPDKSNTIPSYGYNNGGIYWDTTSNRPGGTGYKINGTAYGTGGMSDGGENVAPNMPGASGYVTIKTINVTPNTNYTCTIGSFGYGVVYRYYGNTINHTWDYEETSSSAGVFCSQGGYSGQAGYSGAIFIEWGQGI